MAKKSSVRQAAPAFPGGQAACRCGTVTVESIAADIFVRHYRPKGNYKAEHVAEKAIAGAEEFMKQLSRR